MKIQSLNSYVSRGFNVLINGENLCFCESCFLETHLDAVGWDHRKGMSGRRDCKTLVKKQDGSVGQCQCGLGK